MLERFAFASDADAVGQDDDDVGRRERRLLRDIWAAMQFCSNKDAAEAPLHWISMAELALHSSAVASNDAEHPTPLSGRHARRRLGRC